MDPIGSIELSEPIGFEDVGGELAELEMCMVCSGIFGPDSPIGIKGALELDELSWTI